MSGNEAFEMVSGTGWSRGLDNMLRSGLRRWFKTRTWWVQSLIWAVVVTGTVGGLAFSRPGVAPLDALLTVFSGAAGLIPAVGVVIAMQDALVSEKREGTAAWVLSKPVTRQAFLLSKVISNSLGVLVCMVIVPCLIAYFIIFINQHSLINPLSFLGCMILIFISDFYFLALTLMLGALFSNRAPVIGIPLAILFLQTNLIGLIPSLRFFLPSTLIIQMDRTTPLALSLLMHAPIEQEQWLVLGIVLLECILFVGLAIWRFNREEF